MAEWLQRFKAWSDRQTVWLHQSIQTFQDEEPLECRACGQPYPCPELLAAIKRQEERHESS